VIRSLQVGMLCLCFLVVIGFWMYVDRPAFLYPALPFSHPDKSSVVAKLKQADDEMLVPLSADSNTSYFWVGAKSSQGSEASRLKLLLQKAGWSFLEQEGAGYFFEKDQKRIVITSQMWSRDFVLYKVSSEIPADIFQ